MQNRTDARYSRWPGFFDGKFDRRQINKRARQAQRVDLEDQAGLAQENDSYPLEHGKGYANPADFEEC